MSYDTLIIDIFMLSHILDCYHIQWVYSSTKVFDVTDWYINDLNYNLNYDYEQDVIYPLVETKQLNYKINISYQYLILQMIN